MMDVLEVVLMLCLELRDDAFQMRNVCTGLCLSATLQP